VKQMAGEATTGVTFARAAVTVHEGVMGLGGVVLTRLRRTLSKPVTPMEPPPANGRGRGGGERQNGERPQPPATNGPT